MTLFCQVFESAWTSFHNFCINLYSNEYGACLIQGFSERLITASRPAIGLMFKQVGGKLHCPCLFVSKLTSA